MRVNTDQRHPARRGGTGGDRTFRAGMKKPARLASRRSKVR